MIYVIYFKNFLDVNCGRLSNINFGHVTYPEGRTTYNATALYTCDENYTLVGDEVRICSDDGKWNGSEPRCECKFSLDLFLNWCFPILRYYCLLLYQEVTHMHTRTHTHIYIVYITRSDYELRTFKSPRNI